MSLKQLNYFMLLAAMIISAFLLYEMRETELTFESTQAATQQIIHSESESANLQVASDYLTDQIRLFVVNGKKEFLDNYFEEANVTKRRDKALEALKTARGESAAFVELQNAMNASVKLMLLEYHAARLAAEAYGYDLSIFPNEVRYYPLPEDEAALSPQEKKALATNLVFGDAYKRVKDYIYAQMISCLQNLKQDILNEQETVSRALKNQVFFEHVLTALLIALLLGIVYLTSRLVIFPLQKCIQQIHQEEAIPVKGTSEIRFLAKTYNKMREANLLQRKQLSYEATHDKLTDLYNRRGFEALLDVLDLSYAAVLLVDLDNFKAVNDTYGHNAGDKVLTKLSHALLEQFGDDGFVCRFGGDEFVVVMENTPPAMQEYLSEKILAINETLKDSEKDGVAPISISVGVSFCNGSADVEKLLKHADASLYEAKETGKGNVCFNS